MKTTKETQTSAADDAVRKAHEVLQAAYKAWSLAATLRKKRLRSKRFTYGDQWLDLTTDQHGTVMTERERYTAEGLTPSTNNLIRQMVKTIVGRFRAEHAAKATKSGWLERARHVNMIDELDARALEEFLISGCCVQRVEVESGLCSREVSVENVNMNRFFCNAVGDAMCRDQEIVGQLHDLSVAQLLKRVAGGDVGKAAWVRRLYGTDAEHRTLNLRAELGADAQSGTDFFIAPAGRCRAIEVWTLESREVAVCHNRANATLYTVPWDDRVAEMGHPDTDVRWDIAMVWHCRWLSPMGDLLCEYDSPYGHGQHPWVVKMHPLTDGEVHSFVEDVVDQQKCLNRLISLIDKVIASSAKGVLLYPVNALPNGFSWADVRRVWSKASGVLPYNPYDTTEKPEQVVSNASNQTMYNMVALQMRLMEEISGVNGALQGREGSGSDSASLYDSRTRNASIALTDVFATFDSFREVRDSKILRL